jgi:hypothetical protein
MGPSVSRLRLLEQLSGLRAAARDATPIAGLTHCFYRYPARFSPIFARAAIEQFSRPGQIVLDPYMGGGTTVVEAMVAGRQAVGCDVNELAGFVARVKTTPLSAHQRETIREWALGVLPNISYFDKQPDGRDSERAEVANLGGSAVRPIKKYLAIALQRSNELSDITAQEFVRCVLLNVGQWALNGRRRPVALAEFRDRVQATALEMLRASEEFANAATGKSTPTLLCTSATNLPTLAPFSEGCLADLVVTSPPYPGVHVLYHRWQVDGRRESSAPYWITACRDGNGSSFYTFADRRNDAADAYFAASLQTLKGIRAVVREDAVLVQMIAFGDPQRQLKRYLTNMELAGFAEIRPGRSSAARHQRIWRQVPSRRWHANMKGNLTSAREVVLVHRAV